MCICKCIYVYVYVCMMGANHNGPAVKGTRWTNTAARKINQRRAGLFMRTKLIPPVM